MSKKAGIINELLDKYNKVQYNEYESTMIPTKYKIIGLTTPQIKDAVSLLSKGNLDAVLEDFNFNYYESVMIHALMLSYIPKNNKEEFYKHLVKIVPYFDNWAVVDSSVSYYKIIGKYPEYFYKYLLECLGSKDPFVTRFGVVALMRYYIKKEEVYDIVKIIQKIESENYYLNMAISWFIAELMVTNFDLALSILKEENINIFVFRKAISKGIDSFRVSPEQKSILKALRNSKFK
ncbi:MAG: DNA alkylation repair protein [Erysipelotrichales bacterium]|nr:DNA alkylation repair protein [Erysipelotrichales bacterium]